MYIEIDAPSMFIRHPIKGRNILKELTRVHKMFFILEHYLTDKGVEPEDYGYPAYSPSTDGEGG